MKPQANLYRIDAVGWGARKPKVEWGWVIVRGVVWGVLMPGFAVGTVWFWVCVIAQLCC